MNIKLSIAALVLGGCLLPVAAYSADTAKSAVPANVNETASATMKDNGRADPAHRSAHPVDDSVITTKVKAKIVGDKQTRADHVDVETVDGVVDLTGTARSKATAARHVTLARQVKGVKSVKNNIRIEAADTAATTDKNSDKPRTAAGKSDQPVKDTTITTKVKAKFIEDKSVSATNIHVKTVNGVVRLTGSAKSSDESSKAAELAREVEGVKSVTNNIKVM
ncbi:MAG: BON domain-containing protein [Betaproteobacteria bacterium]